MSHFIGASLRKSIADVTRRKGRTLLVMSGIFIGVLGLTVVNFVPDTIFSAFRYRTGTAANHPDILLSVNQLAPSLTGSLAASANVQAVQTQANVDTQWHVSAAPGHVPISIVSYPDLHNVPITPFQLTSGRFPDTGEIVLEEGDQSLEQVSTGATVTVDVGNNRTTSLRVAGFTRTAGLASPAGTGSARGYMSDTAIRQTFSSLSATLDPRDPHVQDVIAIKVQHIAQANTTADILTHSLQAHQVTVLSVVVASPFNQQSLMALDGVFTLLRLLAILAVVLSSLLILNTVTTLIAEQTQIIGTLKAIGGTRGAILRGYLVSVGIYSALATVPAIALGLWLGYPIASFISNAVRVEIGSFAVAPWIIALSLTIGFGVPLVAALLPLWIGTRITVHEALSAYGISAQRGSGRFARMVQRLTWISQTTWLGLRGLFRKRWRAALTLLTLTLAGTTFLVVQTATAATNQHVANVYSHYSYDVATGSGKLPGSPAPLVAAISAFPNVQRVERFREWDAAQSRWGNVHVLGFQQDTQCYHPQILRGRWLLPGDTDVALLSEEAVAATGLRIGDTLRLTTQGDQPPQEIQSAQVYQGNWRIIGIIHQPMDTLGQIGTVITSVANLNRFVGDAADLTQDVLVQARDHSQSAIDTLARRIDQLTGSVETFQQRVQLQQHRWIVIYALLYSVALIVGAVGMLGLANALVASVLERRREIGLLRSMGGSSWRVARVFWVEGLALGGIAWLMGVLLGLPLAYGFVWLMSRLVISVEFLIAPSAFLVMLASILVITTVASVIPALRASRIRIAEMLRYE